MILKFAQKNIHLTFEVTDDKKLLLLGLSNSPNTEINRDKKEVCSAVAVHISGENPDDHHGGKHTGASCEKTLKYVTHKSYENAFGNKLEFELENEKIKVVLHYQFYENISCVRSWTEVTNISGNDIGLEYLSSFAYTGFLMEKNNASKLYIPHNSWVREVDWKKYDLSELGFDGRNRFSTNRVNIYNTGTWSTKEYLPMGIVEKPGNFAMMWQIENNGSWQWEIGNISQMLYLRASGPTESENHWYKKLKPRESFESIKVAIAVGKEMNEAIEEMTWYRRQIVRKNDSDSRLPVIFNDYMNCLWADPTTEKELQVIDCAAELGAEYYCMDAGWYADGTWWETVGEWQPCSWRFKNGIKEVFNYIRSKGMIPGIWLEIEVMGINCPILNQFSDDCFFVRHGKRVIDHGRYQLDFRNKKVRDFATSVVDRVVTEYGVGYIKMDYNIDAGSGTELDADSFGDGLLKHNRAYLEWIESMMNKYPELIIENCSSGGMRMEYAMLSKHSIQSVSDQEKCLNTAPIAAAIATAVLPEQAAIWSYPIAGEEENITVMNMVNSMLLRIHLSGDALHISSEQKEIVKKGVNIYKKIRKDIPTMTPFYPLGLPQYSNGLKCVIYKNERKSFLLVWRMNTEESKLSVKFDGTCVELLYGIQKNISYELSEGNLLIEVKEKDNAAIFELKK